MASSESPDKPVATVRPRRAAGGSAGRTGSGDGNTVVMSVSVEPCTWISGTA